jgi:hypothetical protein
MENHKLRMGIMTIEQATDFTIKVIVRADMILNWFLGVILIMFPAQVDAIIGQRTVLPESLYRVMGTLFLVFAAWQAWKVVTRTIRPKGLVFAALMAEIPVVILTVALVAMHLPLEPFWRVVLWIGDIYMLLLGAWYFYLARWQTLVARRTAAA